MSNACPFYSAPASIDVLYEIRQRRPELFDKMEIYVDGGVKSGTDVVRCSRRVYCAGNPAHRSSDPGQGARAWSKGGWIRAIVLVRQRVLRGRGRTKGVRE